jgi:beta-galactosidase
VNVRLQEGISEIKAVSNNEGAIIKDAAWFKKVSEPNPCYRAPEAETGGLVSNWFQMPVLEDDDVEEGEFKITDDVYSTRCTFKELLENKEAKAVLFKYLGDFTENPSITMAMGMAVDVVAAMGEEVFTEKLMKKLNRDLTKIRR